MDYDLYHDESKKDGYWHGMLLVPRSTRKQLLEYLKLIRKKSGYAHKITLKDLRRESHRSKCIRIWIEVGVYALIQNFKKPVKIYFKESIYSRNENRKATDYKELINLTESIGAKFILFRERDAHTKMDSSFFPDSAAKVETTFRMGLKGGLHLLFDESNPVRIVSMHFDGHKHHSGRAIDKERIIGRIKGLRAYCSFCNNVVIDDRTSDHMKSNSQDYDDCQLLQLTDLLVSGFRLVLGSQKTKLQRDVTHPCRIRIEEWNKGYTRMQRSRWNKGICISECHLVNKKWQFGDIKPNGQSCLTLPF